MRTGGLLGLAGLKVLGWCFSAKGGVGPPGVVARLEGIDEGVEFFEAVGKVVDGLELVSPCAVESLDGAIEFGAFVGGQDVELDLARFTHAYPLNSGTSVG